MGAVRPVVFLHIGAMKTGTTFLQSLMQANRENLLAAGLLVAGTTSEQAQGTHDIMHDLSNGAWGLLTDRMLAHKGVGSVVSMEFLSFSDKDQAARVVDSLHGADVHVILTVRDASRTMPAQWQTSTFSGGRLSWPAFARQVKRDARRVGAPRSKGARVFNRTQGIPRMLQAWGSSVPSDRLHVITVPPKGSDVMLLWQRFAGVLGVDPATATVPAPRSNSSLGYASTDLMRRLNERLPELSKAQHRATLGYVLAPRILRERAGLESATPMNASTFRFALDWNGQVRRAIRASKAHVVGDFAELPVRVRRRDRPPRRPLRDPHVDEVIAAACTARDGLIELIRERAGHRFLKGQPLDVVLPQPEGATTPERWAASADPLEAALEEVCSLLRLAVGLHDRIEAARIDHRS